MCQKICNSLQFLDEFSTPFRPVEPMRRPENPEDETFVGFFFSAVIFPKFPSKIQLAPVAYIRRTLLRGGRTPDPSSRNCAQRKRPNFLNFISATSWYMLYRIPYSSLPNTKERQQEEGYFVPLAHDSGGNSISWRERERGTFWVLSSSSLSSF